MENLTKNLQDILNKVNADKAQYAQVDYRDIEEIQLSGIKVMKAFTQHKPTDTNFLIKSELIHIAATSIRILESLPEDK